jgi:hypothetical protein
LDQKLTGYHCHRRNTFNDANKNSIIKTDPEDEDEMEIDESDADSNNDLTSLPPSILGKN